MKIGDLEINEKAALAPMAGATDASFRSLCRKFGAAYTVTEMVSSRAIMYNDIKTLKIADVSKDEPPVFIQLFGDDPEIMGEAAKKIEQLGPQGIDINMGCPVPKVAGNGAGSALMKDPRLCASIVEHVRRAVKLPVTVKIRKGWDSENPNAVEVASVCEAAGADAVCVHGRTRNQMYEGKSDPEIIRRVKEAVKIPVIGNGDVTDAFSAARLLEETGCDLLMVGRGALGNPWIFREINAYIRPEGDTADSRLLPPPGTAEILSVMKRHMDALCELKGEEKGMREARKHVGWYIHGMRGAAEFRRRAGTLSRAEDLDILIRDIMTEQMKG